MLVSLLALLIFFSFQNISAGFMKWREQSEIYRDLALVCLGDGGKSSQRREE